MLGSLFLPALADATVLCWPLFRAHLAVGAKLGKLPFLLCVFLSDVVQSSIIWGPCVFCLGSDISPHDRLTSLFFSCDWNESLGQVHHAWLSLRGNPFQGTYSGSCVKSLRKPLHQYYSLVCLNYSNRLGTNFFPEGTTIFPTGLFHCLTGISEAQQLVVEAHV